MAGAEIFPFPGAATPTSGSLQDLVGATNDDIRSALIANRLHRELDLDTLLHQFLREVHGCEIDLNGLCFSPADSHEQIEVGTRGRCSHQARLHFAGQHLGHLELFSKEPVDRVIADLLKPLISPLFNALTHFRLKRSARCDCLTQLGNRDDLDSSLAAEVNRAQRFGHKFSLLIVDIDLFKQVNDRFGHRAGDEVICAVASQIRDSLRTYDKAFRFGGEEFVILLSQTDAASAVSIAERLRREIEAGVRVEEHPEHSITVSIGLAEYRATQGSSDLFDRADRALYTAKGNGRNQVVSAT